MASGIPPGDYDLDLSAFSHKGDQFVAFRYGFKPASITATTQGLYIPTSTSGDGQVVFDVPNGKQVFDVKPEEGSKGRGKECVMIWNEDTQTFELHPMDTSLNLNLNRTASNSHATSTTGSTTSSASFPLSGLPHPSASAGAGAGSQMGDDLDAEGELEDVVIEDGPIVTKGNEAALSVPEPKGRGKGAKGKKPMESAPIPIIGTTKAPAKGKAKAKSKPKATPTKGKAAKAKGKAAEKTPQGKFKSSEFIQDSDEEIGPSQSVSQTRSPIPGKPKADDAQDFDDGMDEFANLLGASLAEGEFGDADDADGEEYEDVPSQAPVQQGYEQYPGYAYDDEDDDEESESEDDELGGARLVVRQNAQEDESEWI
ncbi:hypothetical protein B9479_000338 [Cryptococcus floricola]|uniref:Transcription elongation factor Eaf N-terminal domain-containing protein n=1 Tax=Cryptococcus floricola TaxID=2591691 RepID=A0A5D3B568_9TREE|nr:hypothetical protein B9479_000338 [Cryptococcus floricola]